MQSEVLELKGMIEKLRILDTGFRVFGSKSHRYRIGPALSETELREFEKKHDITLPEDFRLYLRLVGNGREPLPHSDSVEAPWQLAGVGPGYGIYPLSETVDGNRVSQPFPFERKVDIPYRPPYDAWNSDIPGALEICTEGCTSHTHIIVKGPKFGEIWEGYEYSHFWPTGFTFLQWMRDWAERSLRILERERLVEKLTLGMTKEQVAATVAGDWKVRRQHRFSGEYYFEAEGIPARLVLSGKNGVVTEINRSPFI